MSNNPFKIAEPQNPTAPVSREAVIHKRIDDLETKIDAGFGAFRQDMDILLADAKANSEWRGQMEAWRSRTSDAVKGESKTNLDQNGALAVVLTKVDAIEKKTDEQTAKLDTQTRMMEEAKAAASKIWKDPKFKLLMGALWTALLIWLGKHGIEIKLP